VLEHSPRCALAAQRTRPRRPIAGRSGAAPLMLAGGGVRAGRRWRRRSSPPSCTAAPGRAGCRARSRSRSRRDPRRGSQRVLKRGRRLPLKTAGGRGGGSSLLIGFSGHSRRLGPRACRQWWPLRVSAGRGSQRAPCSRLVRAVAGLRQPKRQFLSLLKLMPGGGHASKEEFEGGGAYSTMEEDSRYDLMPDNLSRLKLHST
jgi:hypothetical protein